MRSDMLVIGYTAQCCKNRLYIETFDALYKVLGQIGTRVTTSYNL